MSDTTIDGLGALVAGPLPPWMQLVLSLVADASPALFASLAGPDTAVEIAAPFVTRLLRLAVSAIEDLANRKPESDVRRRFDEALADILEDLKAPAL